MSKQFAHIPVVEAQPIGLREVVLDQSQVESDMVRATLSYRSDIEVDYAIEIAEKIDI